MFPLTFRQLFLLLFSCLLGAVSLKAFPMEEASEDRGTQEQFNGSSSSGAEQAVRDRASTETDAALAAARGTHLMLADEEEQETFKDSFSSQDTTALDHSSSSAPSRLAKRPRDTDDASFPDAKKSASGDQMAMDRAQANIGTALVAAEGDHLITLNTEEQDALRRSPRENIMPSLYQSALKQVVQLPSDHPSFEQEVRLPLDPSLVGNGVQKSIDQLMRQLESE